MCKPSVPAPPDPNVVAQAQTASNKETAITNADLNRISQNTPYGSLSYSVNGTSPNGNPQYTQNVSLAPEQQKLLDKYTQGQNTLADTAIGSLGNVQRNFSQPFSLRNDPTTADFGAQIKQAQDAAYRGQTQYLDPQFADQGAALDSKLANQGLTVGNEAYDKAQAQFGRQKQAAYQSAQDAATSAGAAIQNQGFNQGLQGAGLQFAEYNQPLSSYSALMTGNQPTNPTFGNVPGVNQANTDVAGIQNQGYQNQMAAWNAGNQGINNLFSLGGTLGAAAIKSDRRLKRDIRRVGITSGGIPTYTFRYNNDDEQTYFGVMADEVRHIPGAAVLMPDGFWAVNYGMVP